MYEGQTNTFTLTIDSNGGQGNYDVDIIINEPALPDLVPESLTCPTTETFTMKRSPHSGLSTTLEDLDTEQQ